MTPENSCTCSACGESLKVGAWKCSKCQTAQDWRYYLNFSVPILSLCVALVAVIPDIYPTIAGVFDPAKVDVSAQYDENLHELELEFSNSGSAATFISPDFKCETPESPPISSGVFIANGPVYVSPKTNVRRKFRIDIFNSGGKTIDQTLSGLKDRHAFFSQTRMNLTCKFAPIEDDIQYYDFEDREFFMGFNILYNLELNDRVEFRFNEN